ncbi:uncharacterized protein A1O5_06091 [Cladophialophora psammophila CBS 110553]|uniref:Short chain dehydrogenase n=1 Tax=Cladophialophora psammophila CBS 110553 TaxID=1182543 RepID=W9WT30_9EURO|nr:uncharacterized protein A1O5_06091 [Cladophialophora psammophila CBS 110553]EXJ71098.1 hypothetical protein A1O5_06091 [Cladophialophora psammophila CBS 110553]
MYLSKFESSGLILPRLDNPARYSRFQQYMDTKMLLMMFVSRLAEQISPDDVLINVCNPGMTAGTGLGKDVKNPGFAARFFIPLFVKTVGRSVGAGASVYIHALITEGRKRHGSFISDWTIKPYPRLMYTQKGQSMRERLWQETMEELHFASDSGFADLFASGREKFVNNQN